MDKNPNPFSRTSTLESLRNEPFIIDGEMVIPTGGNLGGFSDLSRIEFPRRDSHNRNHQSNVFMTEAEVRTIFSDYNKNLDIVLKEHEKLKAKNNNLEAKIVEYAGQITLLNEENTELKKERDNLRKANHALEAELNIRHQSVPIDLVSFDTEFNTKITLNDDKEMQIEKLIESESLTESEKGLLKSFYSNYETLKKDLVKMKGNMNDLIKENKTINDKLNEFNSERMHAKTCLNCKEQFSPLLNEEHSCFYHPGKLKYYSCRGCGSDEYYSCCLRCNTCQKGCKNTKHIAVS